MGTDKLHLQILRDVVGVVTKTPSIIFEKLLQSKEVPTDWKRMNVNLIFKKAKKEDLGNSIPFSLTAAQQCHGADLPEKYAKAYGKQ